jgi:pSer/pThr/pTyr-binding forkhead associated (FHA) protein
VALVLNIEEEGKRRIVPFPGPEITIGRGPGNTVVINDPRSSRNHCRVLRTPQGLILEDMESRNGTLLNGAAVKKGFVKPGDEFRVGNVRFVLSEGEAAAASEPDTSPEEDSEGPEEIDLASTAASTRTPDDRPSKAPGKPAPPARTAARSGNGAAPALERGVFFLEGVEGSHVGQRIAVEKSPFVIGRAKECDLQILDKRASGKHARILREGGAYYIEDLGSTNGTAINKRPVQRAGLRSGALIQIGNTTFRAAVPAGAAAPREASPAALPKGAAEEEFVQFDAEKFLARDRSQHPLAVVALVDSTEAE